MRKLWQDFPWVDAIPAVVIVVAWALFGAPPVNEESIHPLLTALSATAGIALGLVTVNLTLLHRPDSSYLERLSQKYHVAYTRATLWPLGYLVVATLLPVVAMPFVVVVPTISTGAAIVSGGIVAAVLCRLLWILKLALGLRSRAANAGRGDRAPAPTPNF